MLRVIVNGAFGRMGREVMKAVWNSEDMELVGAVDSVGVGTEIGTLIDTTDCRIFLENNLEETLTRLRPDVAVDFTTPRVVFQNSMTIIKNGVHPVIGTTGMSSTQIQELIDLSQRLEIGGVIAPNFAIGAVLMIKFATEAARFMPNVEIIELHHDQKIDAPSGTSIKTAEAICEQRGDFQQGLATEYENINGARGGKFNGGIRIHSVRLPGLVAHQEVIFGGLGQTLTIRHDSINRESFMPGVLLGIRKAMHLERVVYGLDKLLFD
ncbi:MAG: 4-hydroxy-tetrahydrodipicolinate reductase [Desulfotomaculaceae bacterium]|nr:4-hydroxy-tetrahydrodipicolinate reductase [Desulfotomaculaceae bacterium]